MHWVEGLSYIDAFYFVSMIVTCQGPSLTPVTPFGKIFVSFMAFVSVGAVAAALAFLFGPFFGKLWRVGVERVEQELHLLKKE